MTFTVVEPFNYEQEEVLAIPVGRGADCIAVSGYANFFQEFTDKGGPAVFNNPEFIVGDPHNLIFGDLNDDDTIWVQYQAQLTVGPHWASIRDVSPVVNVAGFWFGDSDSADESGVQIDNCTWQKVGTESDPAFLQIKLIVSIRLCGGNQYNVTKLSYHLIAVGKLSHG